MIVNENYGNDKFSFARTIAVIVCCFSLIAAPCFAQSHSRGDKKNTKQQPPVKFILGPVVQTPDSNQGKSGDGKGAANKPPDSGGQGTQHP